jgi:hypothetical protein
MEGAWRPPRHAGSLARWECQCGPPARAATPWSNEIIKIMVTLTSANHTYNVLENNRNSSDKKSGLYVFLSLLIAIIFPFICPRICPILFLLLFFHTIILLLFLLFFYIIVNTIYIYIYYQFFFYVAGANVVTVPVNAYQHNCATNTACGPVHWRLADQCIARPAVHNRD